MTHEERNKLVEDNMRIVYHIVNKYPWTLRDDDLTQIGMLALIHAVDTWDESRSKLSSWAYKIVSFAVRRELKRRYNEVRPTSLDIPYGADGTDETLADNIPGEMGVDLSQSVLYEANLTADEMEILEYSVAGGKPSELCEKLGKSRQAINALHRRALYKIKKQMEEGDV